MIFVPRCLDVEREATYCQSSAEETSNNRQKFDGLLPQARRTDTGLSD